ncbi:MAG TPA: amino acid adenylation domain-containing protein [Pyrinomonadaceae bacterium]|nr:amino acid adenylation domain-containing protein [Pyrinomonadaceae bacterium]
MSDLAERIAALSPEQRALFETRLKKQGLSAPQAQGIPRVERNPSNLYPPSIDQERLWFIDQLQPGNTAYNIFTASRLQGPLDVHVMQRACNELLRRHESLRTTFKVVEGQPMQFVAPTLELAMTPVDLESLPEEERELEALRRVTEEFSTPFDLEKGPLIRAGLLRLAPQDHVLYLNMHHSVTDRWSGAIIEKDIGVFYQSFLNGQPSPLAELPIQFADYAVWQRERMHGEAYQAQLAYWKKQLEGAPFVLELPADNPRPAIQTFLGARVYFHLSKALLEALRELSREEGATMYMILMAAYKLLLCRYTGQEDIIVGCSIANRDRPETQDMVGFLLNLLVLRTDLSGNPSFRELLIRERETALGAYAHQDLPFGKLVQELRPKQDPSRNPIAQAAFIYLDFPELTTMEPMGLKATPLVVDNGASRFDLTLALVETPDGLEGSLEYIEGLYERTRIERMAKHLETLLQGIVANPDGRIRELPLLTSEERDRLLFEWNDNHRDAPPYRVIQQLVEAQVERTPDAIALEFEGQAITYYELDGRANQLARFLERRGIGPEVRVALMIERSMEQVVGLLGVLKAGGVYVPLDASSPRERVSFMMADARVRVLLTKGVLSEGLVTGGLEIVDLDRDWSEIALESAERVESGVDEGCAAYIIYTSGSTGEPKGVVVSHRSLVNSILMQTSYGREPLRNTLLLMSYIFDGSLLSIFTTLSQGGTLTIPREEDQADTLQIARLVDEKRTTHLWLVPSLYSLLIEQTQPEQLESLREVHVGAEACPMQLVERHYQLLPQCTLFNVYGPTEATIWSTSYQCRAEVSEKLVPIGRVGTNMQAYILDKHLEPVPVGVAAELYIGGSGVARGYLNHPEMTAEKFIPNPYSREGGERLYRTGDMARYREDGKIEFVARVDHQVKVRGYRIELGEVEAALCELEWVRSAVVMAREDEPGDKRLVAYLVTDEEQRAATQELRERLKRRLPEYMIPASFIFLEEMPLTPNGKVDRCALPPPNWMESKHREAYEAPRTMTEEMLAKLWGNVLGLERVSVHGNFFELGGDSLLATKLAFQVRRAFEIELPLTTLFRHPTIAALSTLVENELARQMDELTEEEAEQLLKNSLESGVKN